MNLAVNYSLPLIRLLEEGSVKTDLIKCPPWSGMMEKALDYGPITIHFDLKTGLGGTFSADLEKIKRLKEDTLTPHINTHLVTPTNFNLHSAKEKQKINTLWRREISLMTEFFGNKSITLENFPYTKANSHIQYAADYNIFSEVILDTDCMLLLDLAHARITADTLQINPKDYIASLPLDRLVELHITGVQTYNGVLTDHFGLNAEDWELFYWAVEQIRNNNWRKPDVVAFEYGGVGEVFAWRTNIEVLREQVPKLYKAIHQ